MPSLEILIPALQVTTGLAETLRSLSPASIDGWAVNVRVGVDAQDLSTYERDLAQSLPSFVDITAIGGPQRLGPAQMRNQLANRSQADFIMFVDSDVEISQQSIDTMIARIANMGESAVFTTRLVPSKDTSVARFFSDEVLIPRNVGARTFVPTALLGMSRGVWASVGEFDGSFPAAAGEDWEWFARLHRAQPQLRVFLHADIRVGHDNPTNLVSLGRRAWRYGLHLHRYQDLISPDKGSLWRRGLSVFLVEVLIPLNRKLRRRSHIPPTGDGPNSNTQQPGQSSFDEVHVSPGNQSPNQQKLLFERALQRIQPFWGSHGPAPIWIITNESVRQDLIPPYRGYLDLEARNRRRKLSVSRLVWRSNHRLAVVLGHLFFRHQGA